jgi:predicted alpha-1,2-mannosidase
MAGTGSGGTYPGAISEFPGADLPFGMIQWSPDTAPDREDGSGYSYSDSRISGFSLTHLSGPGCPMYGDVPILPTVGAIPSHPVNQNDTFDHAHESAAPGRYSVQLGPSGIDMALSVTMRSGISTITFPKTTSANVLFKVADSANPVTSSAVNMIGDDEVTGEDTSGSFCQTGTNYTLYFVAEFDRQFDRTGTWANSIDAPGSKQCVGSTCGGYVTFDTTSDPTVMMKVGISFVSIADAEQNLAAEDQGWSLQKVETQATASWNQILSRIRIGGGTLDEQKTFYTALYHSLLHPNVVSDVNGDYFGADSKIHQSSRPQYANYSEWDIYRSEIQLLSVVAPQQTSDMMQSLVNFAAQNGWLPKWEIVGGDANQMNGDSIDPIIATAYAFGVRGFDASAALQAMVKGATQNETGHGLEFERQYLDEYVEYHYVGAGSLDLTSINYSDGSSVTLEYAIDDFSIAQLAESLGDTSVYDTMMQRSHNFEYLVNPAVGYVEGRNTDGTFPEGPAFQKSLFEPGGEQGFEEGNAIQYTWSTPQDLEALGNLIGGDTKVVAELNTYFTHLNAGRYEPYDWAGNEPNLWGPFMYDFFGAPWRTQSVVRRIVTTEYSNNPVNEPGNDDLGAMSSWYVWAAMGIFPITPGTANVEIASPLFPEVRLELPDSKTLSIKAPAASAATPYVHSLKVSGVSQQAETASCGDGQSSTSESSTGGSTSATTWDLPWLPASVLTTGANLDFSVSATPDKSWASSPSSAPPSFGQGRVSAVGFSLPSGGTTVSAGQSSTIQLGLQQVAFGEPGVIWSAKTTGPATVRPSSGSFAASPASASCGAPQRELETLHLSGTKAGNAQITVTMKSSSGLALPPVVMDVKVTG